MNNYLETIDDAIAQVHSRFYGHSYYPAEDYNRDLQNLIELRSFVEQAVALQQAMLEQE